MTLEEILKKNEEDQAALKAAQSEFDTTGAVQGALASLGAAFQGGNSIAAANDVLKQRDQVRKDEKSALDKWKETKIAELKAARDEKSAVREDTRLADADNAMSPRSMAAAAIYKKSGAPVTEGMSLTDMQEQFGAPGEWAKMSVEQKAKAAEAFAQRKHDFAKMKKEDEYKRGLSGLDKEEAIELENLRAKNEMEKLGELGKQRLELLTKKSQATPKKLPPEEQAVVTGLATQNANRIGIANSIDSAIASWPKMSENEKLQNMRQLIKTLNSEQGKDAVGAEEAKRMAGKLEFALGNFTNDNPTQFGRDLKGFEQDAMNTVKNIRSSIQRNEQEIARRKGGRVPVKTQTNQKTGEKRIVYSDGSTEIVSSRVAGG